MRADPIKSNTNKTINTTSKLGLPSITLLRNQHGQTRRKRHNKKRKQDTRDETDTTTIESRMWSIQAAVAYLRARSVRTLRDPANLRARSFRTWKKCTWSCVVNRAQSLPPTVSPHRHHDSVPRLKDGCDSRTVQTARRHSLTSRTILILG